MSTVFYLVLNMSIIGTIVGLISSILRKVRRISRNFIYILWLVVFIRYMLPVAFPSSLSFMNLTKDLVKRVVPIKVSYTSEVKLTLANTIGAADKYFPITYKTSEFERIFVVLQTVWIIGLTIALAIIILKYCIVAIELRKSRLIESDMYENDNLVSPIVHGILKQKIYIPSKLRNCQYDLNLVLLHERVHILRQDNRIKLFLVFVCCIHWFNPFVWIYTNMFFNDMETSCDLLAVRKLKSQDRKAYAEVLLKLSTQQEVFMAASFGHNSLKSRILNIMNYKKTSKLAFVLSLFFMITLIFAIITNPIK